MTATIRTSVEQWTQKQALILSAICLTAGVAGGWSIRAWRSSSVNEVTVASGAVAAAAPAAAQPPRAAQLRAMADANAAPLIGKLKADANNAELLTSVGNVYYDAQQYAIAVDYYGRALKVKPGAASVRTDMGTAYWYLGDADRAIVEFDTALKDAPNSPNTLFNRGLVKWRGKQDAAGALTDFKKLFAVDPNYAGKAEVEQMMAEAKSQGASKAVAAAK